MTPASFPKFVAKGILGPLRIGIATWRSSSATHPMSFGRFLRVLGGRPISEGLAKSGDFWPTRSLVAGGQRRHADWLARTLLAWQNRRSIAAVGTWALPCPHNQNQSADARTTQVNPSRNSRAGAPDEKFAPQRKCEPSRSANMQIRPCQRHPIHVLHQIWAASRPVPLDDRKPRVDQLGLMSSYLFVSAWFSLVWYVLLRVRLSVRQC